MAIKRKKIKKVVGSGRSFDEQKMGTEPVFDETSTQTDIMSAMNWYGYFYEADQSKKWLVEYMKFVGYDKEEIKLAETISKPKPKVKQKPKKQYTSNKALNEVLNNTKPLGSQEQEDYPTLGGGVLGSDNMAEVLGYGDLGMGSNKERAREVGAVETIKKQGVNVDAVPEDVVNALTRDYSGLMKAMDNKKKGEGNYRP